MDGVIALKSCCGPDNAPQISPSQIEILGYPRMQHIIFAGNCQMESLGRLYQQFVGFRRGDRVIYLPSYQGMTPDAMRDLAEADLVVDQVIDTEPALDHGLVRAGVRRHLVPYVAAEFMWPFGSEEHVHNPKPWFKPAGPFPPQLGDAYLNQKIRDRVNPETAVAQYLDTDLARVVHLDQQAEQAFERQRQRDTITGYRIADTIERFFRDDYLFITPAHPELRVMFELTAQFFSAMGTRTDELFALHEQLTISPYPRDELPIHPSVCRHFGLNFIPDPETHRYHSLNEGGFTFREYALRYMRTEWNPELHEAIELYSSGADNAAARSRITVAVNRSPLSAEGHAILGHLLDREGKLDEAVAAMMRACELDPARAAYTFALSGLYRKQGRTAEALALGRRAVALAPGDAHCSAYLGLLLREAGDLDAAEAVLHRAVQLWPPLGGAYAELGEIKFRKGQFAAAIQALRRATELEPEFGGFHARLSDALADYGKTAEAAEALRRACALAPDNREYARQLQELLSRAEPPRVETPPPQSPGIEGWQRAFALWSQP